MVIMNKTKIYIEFSDEIKQLIQDNAINFSAIFHDENIEVDISHDYPPYANQNNERSKDLVLVILASSAAVLSVGAAVSQIIRSVYRKPYMVQYSELEEIRDANGNVIIDKDGYPILKPTTRYELLEPNAEQNKSQIEFKGNSDGIILKYSSSEDQTRGSK